MIGNKAMADYSNFVTCFFPTRTGRRYSAIILGLTQYAMYPRGLTCSGSNDPTTVSFTGPGSVTLNLKIGSLSGPVSTSLTASATLSGSSFTVTGSLTAGGVGLSNEKIVLVFSWSTNIVTVMTTGGSYTYTGTAPTTTFRNQRHRMGPVPLSS